MKTLTLALMLLQAGPAAAQGGGEPRLRPTAVTGMTNVLPPHGLTYPIRRPGPYGGVDIAPGSVVFAVSGTAEFDSDLHAKVWLPEGGGFRFSVADPEGRRGLLLSALPGAAPLELRIGAIIMTLRQGGRVGVYDGGRVEVEAAGVDLAQGSVLHEGESFTFRLDGPHGQGLQPGDSLSLDLPLLRGFAPPAMAQAPEPAPHRAVRRAKRSPKPATVVAALPPAFESEDDSVRNAVAERTVPQAVPAGAPPFPAPLAVAGAVPEASRKWTMSREATLIAAGAASLVLLAALWAART